MKLIEHSTIIEDKKFFYVTNNNSGKEKVVFLHGFPGNHMGLLDFAEYFARGYDVVMPDFPACGRSEALSSNHDTETYSQWLDAFFQKESIDKAIIIGHSFGARVGLHFAAHQPQKVTALVLIAPVVKADGILPKLALLRYEIAKLLPEKASKVYLSSKAYQYLVFFITFKSKNKQKRNKIMSQSIQEVKNLNPKIHFQMMEGLQRYDLLSVTRKVTTNCLILAGKKDEVATLKYVKLLAGRLKKITLEVMENTGHLLPIEEPKVSAGIVKSWLNEVLNSAKSNI